MPKTVGENICETSNTTGTSPYELEGSVLGYLSFTDAGFNTGDTPRYVVRNAPKTKFEFNRRAVFTNSSPDTLARGTYLSSNSNNPVSWDISDLPLTIYIPDFFDVEPEASTEPEVLWTAYGNGANKKKFTAYLDTDGNLVLSALADNDTETVIAVFDRDGFTQSQILKLIKSTFPTIQMEGSSNGTDLKKWRARVHTDGRLLIGALNDAESSEVLIEMLRNGTMKVTTPTSPTDNTQAVATTAWVNAAILAATGVSLAASSWETGDYIITTRATKGAGWIKVNDGTIGDASSSATARANADTLALFTHLWNTYSNTLCPVLPSGRGANAAADFAAHKTLGLTKMLGRALVVAGTGSGLTARALGDTAGTETGTTTKQTKGVSSGGTADVVTDVTSVVQPSSFVNVFIFM